MHPALRHVEHRPWPLPSGPWIMQQTWNDLLFAHWPVPQEQLRPLVPAQLPLDTYEGRCWVAVAPFHMSGIRARFMPPMPGPSALPELNVRTYVTYDGKAGVYFFSLDAASRLAVWAARKFYKLPYFLARMGVQEQGDWIHYSSSRGNSPAEFRGRYRAVGGVQLRAPGSLEHWLTERYCLYTVSGGTVYRSEIHHAPWPLQDAEAEIQSNTMAAAAGIDFGSGIPLLHFSKKLEVLIWPLKTVDNQL
jgi:uncharacterized protein YqjF (DUF2071 family)